MQRGGSRYHWYALGVLVLVYVVNFVDRQILSILADEIKADLGIGDADLGFLYGTAFAVFYAVFGIPLARLADVWVRKNVIALGLAVWSAMTALSGTAGNLLQLGAYRIGVGVGESSATPAAYSMLSDYFPEKLRATVFSIYIGGVYVGQGLGLFLGGFIIDEWNAGFEGGIGWFGLKGWQAAFFAVGLPGLALAAWVSTLREPRRGQQEGIADPATSERPFRDLGRELATVIPPFTLFSLLGAGVRARGLALHAAGTLAIAALSWALIAGLGEAKQWLALGIGLYAAFAWSQGLALRDPPTFAMLFRSRAMRFATLSVSMASFVTYLFMFWTAPYLLRAFSVDATTVGQYMLIANVLGGLTGAGLGRPDLRPLEAQRAQRPHVHRSVELGPLRAGRLGAAPRRFARRGAGDGDPVQLRLDAVERLGDGDRDRAGGAAHARHRHGAAAADVHLRRTRPGSVRGRATQRFVRRRGPDGRRGAAPRHVAGSDPDRVRAVLRPAGAAPHPARRGQSPGARARGGGEPRLVVEPQQVVPGQTESSTFQLGIPGGVFGAEDLAMLMSPGSIIAGCWIGFK